MNPEIGIFGVQFTAATTIVFIGRLLEHWFPKLATVPPTVKRAAYWMISVASALGVHESFNPGTGTLVITGLTLAGVGHGLWHWLSSVGLQEFVHRSTK